MISVYVVLHMNDMCMLFPTLFDKKIYRYKQMKCITLGILKCQDCDFKSNLSVKIAKYNKIECGDSTCMMPFLHVFTDNDNELLKNIIHEIDGIESVEIDIDDQEKLCKFLNSIRIDEGAIVCKECKREYAISNGIANFMQKK